MNGNALLTLLLVNFALIGLLPILFFRRGGDFNLRWIATGAPFFVVPVLLLMGRFGLLEPVFGGGAASPPVAVVLSTISIALLSMTVGSHRVPLALWHQDDDAPVELVTWGPYARIRHPFYTSFLLAFAAAVVALPHVSTVACLAYAWLTLSVTATREERRLAESRFGEDYGRYLQRTGRFWPRIGS